jgi:hypothetical protein
LLLPATERLSPQALQSVKTCTWPSSLTGCSLS